LSAVNQKSVINHSVQKISAGLFDSLAGYRHQIVNRQKTGFPESRLTDILEEDSVRNG
jgi:hypothetical protein